MNNVDVVYTMWANLKKTAGMDVGQVGFHKQKEVSKLINCVKLLDLMCMFPGQKNISRKKNK